MATFTTEERIMSGRMNLCLDEPFFGVLAMRLKLELADIKTMATDGIKLYYSPAYVDPLSPVKLKGLLAHEVMHNALLHHTRRGNRDPHQWNLACDAAIDHMLKEAGFDVPDSFAEMREWDWAQGLSAEMIYNDPRCKAPSGGGRPGGVMDLPKGMSPAEAEAEMKIALKQAAINQQSHDRRKGKETAWLKQFIDEICEPKVKWQDMLRRFYAPMVPTEQSWARPDRRFVHQRRYLPGMLKSGIGEGAVFFDSSGSCTRDWPQFFGEVRSIFGDVRPERIHFIMCDSSVKSIQTFEQDEEFEPNVEGGGGSDFRPAFKKVAELNLPLKWAVVLSDMEIDFPREAPPYPVIAVATTNAPGPTWATNIKMEKE